MTRHTNQIRAVLVGVIYLYFSGSVLLISRGLAAHVHDFTHLVSALIEALQDVEPDTRRSAAQALGKIGPAAQAAVPALIAALPDADLIVRRSAAWALGSLGPAAQAAVPALTDALQDIEPDVRRSAAWALGRMGPAAQAAVPALITALQDAAPDVHRSAVDTLATIALAARDAQATQMIGPLKAARNALLTFANPHARDQAATVSWVVESLEPPWRRSLREKLLQGMDEHRYLSAGIAVYLTLLLCWLALHWLRPLWLYRINEVLKPYTDFALPAQLGGIKISLRYVLLAGFLHYSRRLLDAWITQHLTTAREEFQRKATVSDRAVHLPGPVILDGQAIPHLTAEHLRPTFNKSRACLLIWGEGGAGKTSLACRVAQWAMADRPMDRLCAQHRLLPVLLEPALELKDTGHPHPFMHAIRRELQALTHEEEPIPEEFLLRLLQRRRVLVIVDHFSEMAEAMRQDIRPGHPEFPVHALVVTSRLEEQLDGVPRTTVKPLRMQGHRLASFLEAY